MRVELRPMEPLAPCLDLMQVCLAINTPIIPPDMLISTSLRMVSPLPRPQDQAHRELHQGQSHRTRTRWFHRAHRLAFVPTQRLPRLPLAPASRGQSLGRRRRMPSS